MAGEVQAEVPIVARLIRHNLRLLGDVGAKDRLQLARLQAVHDHGTLATRRAIHQGQNLVLVSVATALLLALGLYVAVVADKSLVNFPDAAIRAERGREQT